MSKFSKTLIIKVLAGTYIYVMLKFYSSKIIFIEARALYVLPMPKSAWKSSNFDWVDRWLFFFSNCKWK